MYTIKMLYHNHIIFSYNDMSLVYLSSYGGGVDSYIYLTQSHVIIFCVFILCNNNNKYIALLHAILQPTLCATFGETYPPEDFIDSIMILY